MTAESMASTTLRVVSAVPYLSPAEVAHLAASNASLQPMTRQTQMLGLVQAIGGRVGFPQRTVGCAQLLFQRFYLFYNPREFVAHEVAIACTVVASKMCDTPKKARELLLHSWALRYPELARVAPPVMAQTSLMGQNENSTSSPAQTPSSALGLASVSESDIDPSILEKERKRIVSIESLLLQSIAFDFNTTVRDNLRYTIKIARYWQLDDRLIKLAWQIAADCQRTYAPLSYTPATIAIASIYVAALFAQRAVLLDAESSTRVLSRFASSAMSEADGRDDWQSLFKTSIEDVESVGHHLLDMYEGAASQMASTASTAITPVSPATPASPSEVLSAETLDGRVGGSSASRRKLPAHVSSPPPFGMIFWHNEISPALLDAGLPNDTMAELTQLKIYLRQAEDQRRQMGLRRSRQPAQQPGAVSLYGDTLLRQLDMGGICGDVRAMPEQSLDTDAAEHDAGATAGKRQSTSLQRFLF